MRKLLIAKLLLAEKNDSSQLIQIKLLLNVLDLFT